MNIKNSLKNKTKRKNSELIEAYILVGNTNCTVFVNTSE
jgi:hypothetical protein